MLPYLKAIGMGLLILAICSIPALVLIWALTLLPKIFGIVFIILLLTGFVGIILYQVVKWVIEMAKEFK